MSHETGIGPFWKTIALCGLAAVLALGAGDALGARTASAETEHDADAAEATADHGTGHDRAHGSDAEASAPAEGHAGHDEAHGGDHAGDGHHAIPEVHWAWMLPFALLLGSIAIVPLINMHFWEHRYPWFAFILGAITAIYYMFFYRDLDASRSAWLHEMKEYVSFIALLGSLYIVSGGIVINVSRKATPITNTVLLLVGGVIANIFGTTGAAMLLIRPYIRINREHIRPYHVVFFIFIVANCGGSLTPIGDPPLFMGYLKGVPFFWVLEALWPMWATVLVILLAMFFVVDKLNAMRSKRDAKSEEGPAVSILGFQNFLYILLILVAVFQPSMFEIGFAPRVLLSREILMAVAAVAALRGTKRVIYERNEFTYGPIREVAILFLGIFSTMVPALNYLNAHSEQMPLNTPGQYYFTTGVLSSMLDNAPTYLVFLETRQGQVATEYAEQLATVRSALDEFRAGNSNPALAGDTNGAMRRVYEELVTQKTADVRAGRVTDNDIRITAMTEIPQLAAFLMAISVGAVFFGACTYIGNGPNFMVKSIAESAGIRMPSFFGYLLRFALPILIPPYVLIWFLYFR